MIHFNRRHKIFIVADQSFRVKQSNIFIDLSM